MHGGELFHHTGSQESLLVGIEKAFWLKLKLFCLSSDGKPFGPGAVWHHAQHGADWLEEGLVLPRRRARFARRRRGEVDPTGMRATFLFNRAPCRRCWNSCWKCRTGCIKTGSSSGLPSGLSKCPRSRVRSFFEFVKNVPQERNSERNEAIKVPKITPRKCGGRQNYYPTADFCTEPAYRSAQDLVPGKCRGRQNCRSGADF